MPDCPMYCLYCTCLYRLQAKLYPRILAAMKPGATLGLSHGFLLGVMQVGMGGWTGGRAGGWAGCLACYCLPLVHAAAKHFWCPPKVP
jgi:hypothetical protein